MNSERQTLKLILKTKGLITLLSLIFIAICLTGCTTSDELTKAKQFEELAAGAIKQYVKEEYKEYEINTIEDVYINDGFLFKQASSVIKAEIENPGYDKLNILYDLTTNEIYSNKLTDETINKVMDSINIDETLYNDVDIKIISNNLSYLGIQASNFIDEPGNNISDCRVYVYLELKHKDQLEEISKNIKDIVNKQIDCDFTFKIVVDDKSDQVEKPLSLEEFTEFGVYNPRDSLEVLIVDITDKEISEDILKAEALYLDGAKLIYNPLKYKIEVTEADTILGKSKSDDASSDYNISIESLSLDEDRQNNVDSTLNLIDDIFRQEVIKDEIQLNIVTDKYDSVIYMISDTLETKELGISSGILSMHGGATLRINDTTGIEQITMSLYNKEKI